MINLNQEWRKPKKPIPIVIFGAGSIVSDAHLPAYKFSNLPVKGIYDPDYEKAKKLGQIYGLKVFKKASDAAAEKHVVFDLAIPPSNHYEVIDLLPKNFEIIASSKDCQIAGFQNEKLNIFGLQFHPEVTHTNQGKKILKNFIFEVCKCRKNWSTSDIIDSMVNSVQDKVKDEKVLLGLSGGVDSSVVALSLIHI